MKPEIIQSAEDNWPEDEASAVFSDYYQECEDNGEATAKQTLQKSVARFQKVFGWQEDGAQLFARFTSELKRLGAPI